MESIAFYSYQEGVGRSDLLVEVARRLATIGKKVVALDLDFESPSLHYKLLPNPLEQVVDEGTGALPFLVALGAGKEAPDRLRNLDVAKTESEVGSIRLVPAGNAPSSRYWDEVGQFFELLDFSDPGGLAIAALLELKARIEIELEPDVLLIDTRSGITELGGVATTLLADAVICLAPQLPESLDGTRAVVAGLRKAPRLAGQRPLQIFEIRDSDDVVEALPQIFPAESDP